MDSAKGKAKVNRDEKQTSSKLDEQIDKVKAYLIAFFLPEIWFLSHIFFVIVDKVIR